MTVATDFSARCSANESTDRRREDSSSGTATSEGRAPVGRADPDCRVLSEAGDRGRSATGPLLFTIIMADEKGDGDTPPKRGGMRVLGRTGECAAVQASGKVAVHLVLACGLALNWSWYHAVQYPMAVPGVYYRATPSDWMCSFVRPYGAPTFEHQPKSITPSTPVLADDDEMRPYRN